TLRQTRTLSSLSGRGSSTSQLFAVDGPSFTAVTPTCPTRRSSDLTWNGTTSVLDGGLTTTASSLTRTASESVGAQAITNGAFNLERQSSRATSFDGANTPALTITPTALSDQVPSTSKGYGADDPSV